MAAPPADPPTYDDPETPLRPRKKLLNIFKKLLPREKKLPRGTILPLTKNNLEVYFNPDYADIRDAFFGIRTQRKVSVLEWLQLLP